MHLFQSPVYVCGGGDIPWAKELVGLIEYTAFIYVEVEVETEVSNITFIETLSKQPEMFKNFRIFSPRVNFTFHLMNLFTVIIEIYQEQNYILRCYTFCR